MQIETKIQQKVTVWIEQEIIVEVNSIEEFKEYKEKNTLGSIAIDWDTYEMQWDTLEYIDEDDSNSKIEEINRMYK